MQFLSGPGSWQQKIAGFVGTLLFIVLLIGAFVVFSYVLIFGALIGLVVLTIAWIRIKYLQHKYHNNQSGQPSPNRTADQPAKEAASGRIIDHED